MLKALGFIAWGILLFGVIGNIAGLAMSLAINLILLGVVVLCGLVGLKYLAKLSDNSDLQD